jgi:transcriptional regulator NrdR family protein
MVRNTIPQADGIKRYRACRHCGYILTTFEKVGTPPPETLEENQPSATGSTIPENPPEDEEYPT